LLALFSSFFHFLVPQGDPCVVDLFHKEFRGKQKYITCCGACGCASEREEALEELQLQIKGRDTVCLRVLLFCARITCRNSARRTWAKN